VPTRSPSDGHAIGSHFAAAASGAMNIALSPESANCSARRYDAQASSTSIQ
jgi:hypothetical protein